MSLILAYHGVIDKVPEESQWIEYSDRKYELEKLCVSSALFEKQLAYLHRRGYHSISLRELVEYRQKGLKTLPKSIAITFDDGFQNCFSFARPLLRKYGYTATIFLVTDKINTDDRNFLSWEEIFQMQKEGFSFGAHTLTHSLLTSLSLNEAKREIKESKKLIEEKLEKPCEFFSYPYGEFDSAIQKLVKEAGFLGAVVTPHGPGVKEGPYSLKRVGINKNNSMWVFKFKAGGGFSWLREQGFLWKILTKIKSLKKT